MLAGSGEGSRGITGEALQCPSDRVAALREVMRVEGWGAAILPTADPHLSEYPPAHFSGRAWVSGFLGSAGTLVVTPEVAALWTDGRYYIQAAAELAGSGIELQRAAEIDCPKLECWLAEHVAEGASVVCDGRQLSVAMAKTIRGALAPRGITLVVDRDPLEAIWVMRPPLPDAPAWVLSDRYAGESVEVKLAHVRREMEKLGADHYLVSRLDSVGWLLNLRGGDIACTPLVLAYLLVGPAGVSCFLDPLKRTSDVMAHLARIGVDVVPYDAIHSSLSALLPSGASLLLDPKGTCTWLEEAAAAACTTVHKEDPVERLKAEKNPIELGHMRASSQRDAVCFAGLFRWIDHQLASGAAISECGVVAQLEAIRSRDEAYRGPSFSTIAAYGEHAALMHYGPTPEGDATLAPSGFLLVDAGGQYVDGTTDMTRTHACGVVSEQQQRDYTLVLKGHIALARAIFLEGTTGHQLDILARAPLAREGLDYRCGTGHGIGFCGCVHEGPQNIGPRVSSVKLAVGMVLTNEPGVYREGAHGIRIENTLVVREHQTTECGRFLAFEQLSYFPIDLRPVRVAMLDEVERAWIDAYHAACRERLLPLLDEATAVWLTHRTQPLDCVG
jgi:Xaa-Pro aminopeptidase